MNFQCGVIPGPLGAAALRPCAPVPSPGGGGGGDCALVCLGASANADWTPCTAPRWPALSPDPTDPPPTSPPFQSAQLWGDPRSIVHKTFIPSVCLPALLTCMINAISASRLSVIF